MCSRLCLDVMYSEHPFSFNLEKIKNMYNFEESAITGSYSGLSALDLLQSWNTIQPHLTNFKIFANWPMKNSKKRNEKKRRLRENLKGERDTCRVCWGSVLMLRILGGQGQIWFKSPVYKLSKCSMTTDRHVIL